MQYISITFGIKFGVMIMVTGADMNLAQNCTALFIDHTANSLWTH